MMLEWARTLALSVAGALGGFTAVSLVEGRLTGEALKRALAAGLGGGLATVAASCLLRLAGRRVEVARRVRVVRRPPRPLPRRPVRVPVRRVRPPEARPERRVWIAA